jgi:hypothetical protein
VGSIIYTDAMPPVRGKTEGVVRTSSFDRASKNLFVLLFGPRSDAGPGFFL